MPDVPTHHIDDLPAFLHAVYDIHHTFSGQPWWRGQSNVDWSLVPHVHRLNRSPRYEANVLVKFEKRARTRHDNCPERGDLASWLFLAQHYRLPTRLLDWTEAALVGLYFAVEEEKRWETGGAVWALDPFTMNAQLVDEPGIQDPGFGEANSLVEAAFSRNSRDTNLAVGLITEELDLRMMVQQAGFTIHGSPRPLEKYAGAGRFLHKLEVDAQAKEDLLRWIKRLGVRERTLFPDLEHLANDLKEDRYSPAKEFRH